jgi:hypothetical protein
VAHGRVTRFEIFELAGVDAALARFEAVGVYESIPAPFLAPPGYRPILQPEFPWDYF